MELDPLIIVGEKSPNIKILTGGENESVQIKICNCGQSLERHCHYFECLRFGGSCGAEFATGESAER